MKKALLFAAFALAGTQASQAQTVLESKTFDNIYVGLHGGLSAKTTHTKVFKNLNPTAGIRIGRYFTPVVGLAVDGDLFFDNAPDRNTGTFFRGFTLDLLGTVNLTNWIDGYIGEPHFFEVSAIAGAGWDCRLYSPSNKGKGTIKDDGMVSKLGLKFDFNLGQKKAWQLYIEPTINHFFANNTSPDYPQMNVNNSYLELTGGIIYKFKNSNGTHNFAFALLRDPSEIDGLNARINELRQTVNTKDQQIAQDANDIAELQRQLNECRNQKPKVVEKVVKVNGSVLQPTVIFGQGKSSIDAAQYASVAMVAKYMKNHPSSHILIKGYASPEGSVELNQRLSENRAQAVKDALVNRYGISSSRLTTQGMGATDELFEEIDFNRVATFTDTTK